MGMIGYYKSVDSEKLQEFKMGNADLLDYIYDRNDGISSLDVDKTWHAIHFLLNGEAWGGNSILSELVLGGEPVNDIDIGYGPVRCLSHEMVSNLDLELASVSEDDLLSNYGDMLEKGTDIYPGFGDSKEDKEYIVHYFRLLKEFVHACNLNGENVLIWTG